MAFQFLKVGPVFRSQGFLFRHIHLAVQDVHSLNTDVCSLVDDGLDRDLLGLEVPVGVGGDAEFDPLVGCGFGFRIGRRHL